MSFLKNKRLHQKPIAWSLVVAFLLLTLLPIQIHIYHDLESGSHDDHAIDYHMMMDDTEDVDHFSLSDTHVIETTSDFVVKQTADNQFKVAVFVIFFLLVPLLTFSYYQRYFHTLHFHYQKYYSLSPPLRAPPL
jgi:hypothetical protein